MKKLKVSEGQGLLFDIGELREADVEMPPIAAKQGKKPKAPKRMRPSRIVLPENNEYVQASIVGALRRYNPYPPIGRGDNAVLDILEDDTKWYGLDLEYDEYEPGRFRPSILGLSSLNRCAATKWNNDIARKVTQTARDRERLLVGHAVIGADKPVLDEALGVETPLAMWGDSMLTHFLCHQDFAKTTHKEEDADDSGSLGFMSIWAAAAMVPHLMIPMYKACRGKTCDQYVCPRHNVFNYCSIDSYLGLHVYLYNMEWMRDHGVPLSVVEDMHEMAQICQDMEDRGIAIDRDYVAQLRREMKEQKDAIFDWHMEGKTKVFHTFNPQSPAQVVEWFKRNGISLGSSDKKLVYKQLEKQAAARGFATVSDLLDYDGELPPAIGELIKLYEFKDKGKGPDPWFGAKYFRSDGYIHPRFIITGASSTRLASSKPNFQNIGNKGWAVHLKRAVVPRSPDLCFVESDSSQLELRACLYMAGESTKLADGIFERLVAASNGEFDRGAEFGRTTTRFVAKSAVHATNYDEGLKIFTESDLRTELVKRERACGALEIDESWEYGGGVVGFTGANLAERLFGEKTYEKRALALKLRRIYLDMVPAMERWHRIVLREIEETGMSRLPTGHVLMLHGDAREKAKVGIAFKGQGLGAQYIQGIMRKFKKVHGDIPDINVHDSLLFAKPREWTDKQCYDFISLMYTEVERIPGFAAPGKATRGLNYGDLMPLEKE